jgi:K+-transporting ATPase ATPase C chain
MKILIRPLKAYVILTILLGLMYPLIVTMLAQAMMPLQANGSLALKNGAVAGSFLIGQEFTKPEYFHARPSANNYDGVASGGTNLGPTSRKLMEGAAASAAKARAEYPMSAGLPLPADMVLASASGLDPHISKENAVFQAPRVAGLRGVSADEIYKMIEAATDPDFLGIWGRPGVNVLKLNIALDARKNR